MRSNRNQSKRKRIPFSFFAPESMRSHQNSPQKNPGSAPRSSSKTLAEHRYGELTVKKSIAGTNRKISLPTTRAERGEGRNSEMMFGGNNFAFCFRR